MKIRYLPMFLPLLATVLFSGCFLGIKREVVIDWAPKEYEPLVTTNTIAVCYGDGARLLNTPARREFHDFIDQAGLQFQEGVKEAAGEAVAAELANGLNENPATFLKDMTGLEESDVKWTLTGVENFRIDLSDLDAIAEKGIDFPRVYAAVHTSKPLDVERAAGNIKAFIEKSFAEDGAEGTNALAEVRKVIRVEKTDYRGAVAYRLRVDNEEFAKYLHGFAPVVTTMPGGYLTVMATSEELLDEVWGLYNGDIPAAPADSAIAKELQIPDDVVCRFAFPAIGDFIRSHLTDELAASVADDELASGFLNEIVALRYDSGAMPDSPVLFERLAVDFASEATAANIAESIRAAYNVAAGFVQIGLAERPELAFVTKILQGIQIANSGNTCVVAVPVKLEDLKGVDFKALGRSAAECLPEANEDGELDENGFNDIFGGGEEESQE